MSTQTETQAIRTAAPIRRGPLWALKWLAMTFGLLVILITLWQVSGTISPSPEFPPPSQIWDYFVRQFFVGGARFARNPADAWLGHAVPSFLRILGGFILGCTAGIILGIFTGLSKVFRYSSSWILEFLRAIPTIAVLPLFIVVLAPVGPDWTRIIFIAYGVSLYVLINTASGVSSVDPTLIMMGRSFRLSKPAIVWRIVLPAAQPQIWAGLRIATIGSMILGIVSEFLISTNGIGWMIQGYLGPFVLPGMWAWILILAIFGLTFNLTIEAIERRVLRWHRNSH